MAFDNNLNNKEGSPRPSTHWNNSINSPLTRVLTPYHNGHYDIQYQDSLGNVQARMDGLSPTEVQILKTTKNL